MDYYINAHVALFTFTKIEILMKQQYKQFYVWAFKNSDIYVETEEEWY